MLTPTSNAAITHYPATPKTTASLLRSLPLKIQQEIEDLLDFSSQQALFKALTTATRDGEPIDSPVLKLHLIKNKIQAKYQGTLISSDENLKEFAFSQLRKLANLCQLDQIIEKSSLFELICLANDSQIFQFLQEKIQQEPQLKQTLLNWVERSKTEEVRPLATSALTLLIKAGVQFNGADLRGIKVPGADLSYGVFDSAQLQGADLSRTNLRAIWLRQANLSGAKMEGVRFGEWPYLQEETKVTCCTYSPDGRTYAVGLEIGMIHLYDTSNWEIRHTLTGHTGWVDSIAYSPSGQQIASASRDRTVRLWDALTGQCRHTLVPYTGSVNSVVYSPNGQHIASANKDNTLQLWDAQNGRFRHLLAGHIDSVERITYSPAYFRSS